MHTRHTHSMQCSVEMQQILRLARRDGDEWVRLFATILAPFPHSQTTDVEPCTEGNMEGLQNEVAEACKEFMANMRKHDLGTVYTNTLYIYLVE